jgi:predicted ester cyclase
MGVRENLEVHTRWSELQGVKHDLSQHEDFVHPDIVIHHVGGPTVVGLDAMRKNAEAAFAAMPDYHMTMDDQFATDDRVVCRWRVRGTPVAEIFGVPPDGNPVEIEGVSIWAFVDGKAKEGWVYSNADSLARRIESGRD